MAGMFFIGLFIGALCTAIMIGPIYTQQKSESPTYKILMSFNESIIFFAINRERVPQAENGSAARIDVYLKENDTHIYVRSNVRDVKVGPSVPSFVILILTIAQEFTNGTLHVRYIWLLQLLRLNDTYDLKVWDYQGLIQKYENSTIRISLGITYPRWDVILVIYGGETVVIKP